MEEDKRKYGAEGTDLVESETALAAGVWRLRLVKLMCMIFAPRPQEHVDTDNDPEFVSGR